MENGCIIDTGTHSQLIQKSKLYKELYHNGVHNNYHVVPDK